MAARPRRNTSQSPLTVTNLVPNVDMRGIHKVRARYRPERAATATLLLNKRATIARFIVPNGGVWTYYAPPKRVWDEAALEQAIRAVTLRLVWREGAAWPEIVAPAKPKAPATAAA